MTNAADAASAGPRIALVVCTRDRADRLPACLDAIRRLDPRVPWELVLVDNGSRDDTVRLLGAFAPSAPFPVRIAHEPRPGLARARNAGVAAARAPLLAFVDDDCYPAPDFLDRWVDAFADAALGYGTGRILLFDPADAPITVRVDATPYALPAGGLVLPGQVQGANMAFRREALAAIGGFDPALGPGTPFNCEDLDVASRASQAGWAGGYFPAPLVHHHHRRRAADVPGLVRSYDRGKGAYFAGLLLRGMPASRVARAWYLMTRLEGLGAGLRMLLGGVHYLAFRLVRRRR